jgi:hypothetical protein
MEKDRTRQLTTNFNHKKGTKQFEGDKYCTTYIHICTLAQKSIFKGV